MCVEWKVLWYQVQEMRLEKFRGLIYNRTWLPCQGVLGLILGMWGILGNHDKGWLDQILFEEYHSVQRMNIRRSVRCEDATFDSFCENHGEKWLGIMKEMIKGMTTGDKIRERCLMENLRSFVAYGHSGRWGIRERRKTWSWPEYFTKSNNVSVIIQTKFYGSW